jgi:alanyl-tRNA synthetase
MAATPRLYWTDSLLFRFEARVVAHARLGGAAAVELSQTAFYPEVGGQLGDRGRASWDGGGADIVDAQEDGDRVLHVLAPDAPVPPVGARVRVEVDEARRRDHMSQHTGQHLLSRALLDRAGAPTVSSRLGESACTVDVAREAIPEDELAEAEALVNRVVLEDRPVRALMPSPEELARLPLRREPKVKGEVRVIEVEGFDFSPCGGTHVSRTGQVGTVHVHAVERYKGGLRLSFNCGLRAARELAEKDRILSSLAREFSTGFEGVAGAVARLKADNLALFRAAGALRERLAALHARDLLQGAPRVGTPPLAFAAVRFDGETIEFLRALSAALATERDAVAIVWGASAEGVRVLAARGAGAGRFDAGAALRRIASAAGGRGGGRADRAEGVLPAGSDPQAAVERERRLLEAGQVVASK